MSNTLILEIETIFFSVGILILGVIFTYWQVRCCKLSPKQMISYLLAIVSLALYPFLFISIDSHGGEFDRALRAVYETIRTILGDNSILDVHLESFDSTFVAKAEAVYISLLHITAFALILGFLLSFLQNSFPYFRYRFASGGRLCVFSELSERAVYLIKDTREKYKSAIIVVLNMNHDAEQNNQFWDDIQRYNVITLNKNFNDPTVNKKFVIYKDTVDIFMLSEDETKNLQQALELVTYIGDKRTIAKEVSIHILNSQKEAETVLDSVNRKDNIKLALIRENKSVFYELFYNNPFFLWAKNRKNKTLILGAGHYELEAAKISSWLAHTLHSSPHIIVVDKNEETQRQFKFDCPEIPVNSSADKVLDDCIVEFVHIDVESEEFINLLKKHNDIGYVVCTLGTDSLNIKAAMTVRSYFEQFARNANYNKDDITTISPFIAAFIENAETANIVANLNYRKDMPCNIHPFGNHKARYTWGMCVSPYFNTLGKMTNRHYCGVLGKLQGTTKEKKEQEKKIAEVDNSYNSSEYNKASSIASGLHTKYKLYSALVELKNEQPIATEWLDIPSDQMLNSYKDILTQELNIKTQLGKLEHRRWNMYLRSIGWRKAECEQIINWFTVAGKHEHQAAKLHPCIVSWEELNTLDTFLNWLKEELDNKTDEQSITKSFQQKDIDIIEPLPSIVSEANKAAMEAKDKRAV